MRTEAEVLDSLTGVLWSAEEERVGSSRRAHGKLVERQALAAGLLDARTGSRSEAQRGDGELRHLDEAVVVGDGANENNSLALMLFRRVLVRGGSDYPGDRHWRAVDLGHVQAAGDGLVELAVGPP